MAYNANNAVMNYAAFLGSNNKAPMLIPEHYDQWADRIEDHLSGIDEDLLRSLKEGPFTANVQTRFAAKSGEPTTPPVETEATIAANKRKIENDKRSKEIWDKLKMRYEGTDVMKKSKVNNILADFSNFKQLENEKIDQTFKRSTDVVYELEKHGVSKTSHETNFRFMQCLRREWKQITMMVRSHEKINSYSLEELYNSLKSYEYDVLDEAGDPPNAGTLAFVSKTESDDVTEADDEGEEDEESDTKALYSNNNKNFQKRPRNKTNFNRNSNIGKQPTKSAEYSKPKSETTPRPEKKLLGDSGYDCNYCYGNNNLAKDCMLKKANEKKERVKDEAYYTKKLEEVRAKTQSLSLIAPNNGDGTYQIWSSGSDDDEIRKPTHGAMFAAHTGHGIWSDGESSDEEMESKITGVCLMAQGTNTSPKARLSIPE
ncbi:hypothetical protein L1887_39092 [Cichorium endivia]|nr:hypothetical protein L1887_39092 [Cichorium endivia]